MLKPGEEKTLSEVLKEIKKQFPNTNIEDLVRMIGISVKTYHNIINDEKIKETTIDKLRGFMESRFNLSFGDLQNGKVQIVKKQIVNVKGNYTFSNETGNEEVTYLVKQLIIKEKEISELQNEVTVLKDEIGKRRK